MVLRLGPRAYDLSTRALVVGVVPAGAGSPGRLARLVDRAAALAGQGADVVEVAAAEAVAADRVAAAVAAVAARVEVPVAVRTGRASVAAAAFAAGAGLGDDPTGFADEGYLAAAARAGAAVVAAHPGPAGPGAVGEVAAFLSERAARAGAAGVERERIVVDPGLELGKPPGQALALLGASGALAGLGYPLALSVDGGPVAGEGPGAGLAAAALGVALGCRLVRTADVAGARQVCDTLAAVAGAGS